MTEEALETLVVLLVICKLNTDHSKSREDIGKVMAVLQGMVIALFLLDVLLTTLPIAQVQFSCFKVHITNGSFCRKQLEFSGREDQTR